MMSAPTVCMLSKTFRSNARFASRLPSASLFGMRRNIDGMCVVSLETQLPWRSSRPQGCTHCIPVVGTSGYREPSRFEGKSRSEEHTSELQSHVNLVCRLLLEKKVCQILVLIKVSRATLDNHVVIYP